jgi:hypothetical protein
MMNRFNGAGLTMALAICAGSTSSVMAQPVVDGVRDASYGDIKFTQTQKLVAPVRDNFAGAGGSAPTDTVTSGLELLIPLSALNASAGFSAANPLRMTVVLTGAAGASMSNQVLGSLQGNQTNFGDIRTVNLETIPGGDAVSFNPTSLTANDGNRNSRFAIIDGQLVGVISNPASNLYGAPRAQQQNFTGYGDALHASCSFGAGSELNAVYGYVVNLTSVADPTQSGRYLSLFLAGNLEVNGNGIEIFFDTVAGEGQNRLLFGNTQGRLVAMSESAAAAGDGLAFATGFAPDFWVGVNAANGDETPDPDVQPTLYVDYASLPTDPVATLPTNFFAGQVEMCSAVAPAPADAGTLTGGDLGAPVLRVALNNSNIGGVAGSPPGGQAPNVDSAFGSEINNVFATVDTNTNTLYLFMGGNLQSDNTKMALFFDAAAPATPNDPPPGQNRMLGNNVDISFNGLNRFGDDGTGNGLTFDADFAATFWMAISTASGNPGQMYIDSAALRAGGRETIPFFGGSLEYGSYSGVSRTGTIPPNNVTYPGDLDGTGLLQGQTGTAGNLYANFAPRHISDFLRGLPLSTWDFAPLDPAVIPTNATPGLIIGTLDNRNVGGVTASATVDAANVSNGLEIAVKLSELGWDGTSCVKLVGMVMYNNYAAVSNQVTGVLPENSPNLGEVRSVNFSNETAFPGNQYVTLWCPSPVSCIADYNRDQSLNLDDLSDFITDFYTVPPIPGGIQPNAPTYQDIAPGFGQVCINAGDAPSPYDVNAYRQFGFRTGYSADGSNSCPGDPEQNFPSLDNLSEFITLYYSTFGVPGNGCN